MSREALRAGISVGVLLLLLVLLMETPSVRRDPSGAPSTPTLQAAAEAIVALWDSGNAQAMEPLLLDGQVGFLIFEDEGALLRSRQVVALLKTLFREYRGEGVALVRVEPVGSSGSTGFVEFGWSAVADGTSEVIQYTLFFSLQEVDAHWMIDQIRLIEPPA